MVLKVSRICYYNSAGLQAGPRPDWLLKKSFSAKPTKFSTTEALEDRWLYLVLWRPHAFPAKKLFMPPWIVFLRKPNRLRATSALTNHAVTYTSKKKIKTSSTAKTIRNSREWYKVKQRRTKNKAAKNNEENKKINKKIANETKERASGSKREREKDRNERNKETSERRKRS